MTSERYTPSEIEPKWQAYWDRDRTFLTDETPGKERAYLLDMFPYPSGAGLHVGHPEGYTATDIMARYLRAKGVSVLHPMGWDAFGLPAEQHAIQTGTHPRDTTVANIATFKRQLKSLGFSYDWDREIDTTAPDYVRWTQWIFLELFQRGLAYQDEIPVNWCPALGTVLANEEVKDGVSERGGHPVVRMPLRQWMLRITAYADRLLEDLSAVTRIMQTEWIGRSEGAEVRFGIDGTDESLEVFTTRPDTLFGVSFLVLAPEHPLVAKITAPGQRPKVDAYIARTQGKSELDRRANKDKSGEPTGAFAVHPLDGRRVPIWIADYVLFGYGTGAVMGVPGHDERDFEFAKAFDLPITRVVRDASDDVGAPLARAFVEEGIACNSGIYDGLSTAEFKQKVTADLEAKSRGKRRVEYKLRDWIFSRQRYWGEPIPIYFPVECEGDPRTLPDSAVRVDYGSPIAVSRDELPIRLPDLEDFRPGNDPLGPLAKARDWRFFQRDGKWFARETNTMPQWAGSCWYYLRFIDPKNTTAPFSIEKAAEWLPVKLYVGGAEHAVLHLLYARFWHKVLYDAGLVAVKEPFARLVHQGMILGEVEYTTWVAPDGAHVSRAHVEVRPDAEGVAQPHDSRNGSALQATRVGEDQVEKRGNDFVLKADASMVVDARAHKMSKSRGNVINPDSIVTQFGADSLRLYEMFMGPLEATKPWSTASILGVRRFLDRVYTVSTRMLDESAPDDALERALHRAIRKVGEDIEALRFNTAISTLMTLTNELYPAATPKRRAIEVLVQLLHPLAPHIAEELWEHLGHRTSIQRAPWPSYDPELCVDLEVEIPVQINGKVRGRLKVASDASEGLVIATAGADPTIARHLEGKTVVKQQYVPGRILTVVVK
jgi:leucyl-tRNA synthetase